MVAGVKGPERIQYMTHDSFDQRSREYPDRLHNYRIEFADMRHCIDSGQAASLRATTLDG